MIRSIRKKHLILAACLLFGTFAASPARAGYSLPPYVEGDYATTNLGQQYPGFPLSFTLSQGELFTPSSFGGILIPADLTLTVPGTVNNTGSLQVNFSNFTLNGDGVTITGSIAYQPVANTAGASGDLITAEIVLPSLSSNTTSPNVDTTYLNPAELTLFFPGLDFNEPGQVGPYHTMDINPAWVGFNGPVYFYITQLPEPASIVHLVWAGALGAVGYWRRFRGQSKADLG